MNRLSNIVNIAIIAVFFALATLANAAETNANEYTKELFQDPNDPVQGNPHGNVTLVEFLDYECPYCIQMSEVINRLSKKNPQLRVVYKQLSIHGDISDFAAEALLAANKQGKFLAFHHKLMNATRPLTNAIILNAAKSAGLDVDKLQMDMSDPAILSKLRADYKLADNINVMGTPTFFIGKTMGKGAKGSVQMIFGEVSEGQLQEMINKAGK